jgi:hypothetical protein
MRPVYYALLHVRDFNKRAASEKLIGIYSSEEQAKSAILRTINKPGFRTTPDNYIIEPMTIGEIRLRDGFKVS